MDVDHTQQLIRRLCGPLMPKDTPMLPVLTPLKDVRAVLLDIYGTVLISASGDVGTVAEAQPASAMHRALASVGIPVTEEQSEQGPARLRELIVAAQMSLRAEGADVPEVDIREIWSAFLLELVPQFPDLDVSSISAEETALQYECRANPVWPMPHVLSAMEQLKASDMDLGIVSNAQFYTPLILEALFERSLDDLGFSDPDLISWSWLLRRAKPSPDCFQAPLEALGKRGIPPEQVVYIGNDMLNDVYTASRAGCRTILFAGDKRSLRLRSDKPECRNLKADAVMTCWSQWNQILSLEGAR